MRSERATNKTEIVHENWRVFQTPEQTHLERHLERPRTNPEDASTNDRDGSDTDRQAAQRHLADRPDNSRSAFGRVFDSR